jgi:S1-C subfamily serine protease
MPKSDWEIPAELQPDPTDFSCDVDQVLRTVVGLKSIVPEDAFTAGTLGTEREGSAVLIRRDGLALTIGYLITEAETIWLTTADGRAVPGHALAIDFESGFGLVQALGRLDLPAIEIAEGEGPKMGATAMLGSAGGRGHAVGCSVVARQPFAGYWEYLLDDAIFTAPAHPSWGGAGLIGPDGKLLGIGSLVLEQTDKDGRRLDINMCVPAARLAPVLDDMLSYGRARKPPRPWLGLYATEDDEGIVVASLAPKGPAEQAGLRPGDRVREVGGSPVSELADLWRGVWASGAAGATVRLGIARRERPMQVAVTSADRQSFLKAPRLH